MQQQEDLYKILGIEKNANQEDIRKAYRSLSLKCHPDRNPENPDATSTFQSINSAYEILGDERKRKIYDQTKNTDNKQHSFSQFPYNMPFPFREMNFNNGHDSPPDDILHLFASNIFNQMHKGMGMHGSSSSSNNNNLNTHFFTMGPNGPIRVELNKQTQKPTAISIMIDVSIDKAFQGCVIPVDITRNIMEGDIKKEEKETLYVTIPRGIDDNEIIILSEKGHSTSNDVKGDVKIQVKIKNDTLLRRDGLDLILHKSISLKEALCGFIFNITFIDGRVFKINNNVGNIIHPNFKKTINGMGMVRDNNVGNLIIIFNVIFPEKLSNESIMSIQNAL